MVARRAKPLFPTVAVRELIANALIHQDMTITGAGPIIELFRNRLEITNPGAPLVETDRFIDAPPRSRNEALAALMRRMGLCEEGGTGIARSLTRRSPSTCRRPSSGPKTMQPAWCCSVPVVSPELTTEERLRACYLHAGLTYLRRGRMRNSTLRKRFCVEPRNAAQVSKVIRQTLDRGLIRPGRSGTPEVRLRSVLGLIERVGLSGRLPGRFDEDLIALPLRTLTTRARRCKSLRKHMVKAGSMI